MKKGIVVFVSIILALTLALSAAGCSGDEGKEKKESVGQGEIFTLSEAYERELVGAEDVARIASYQNGEATCSERLTDDEIAGIKDVVVAKLRAEKNAKGELSYPDATAKDVVIEKYYGTYNGGYAVMLTDSYHDYTEEIRTDTVGGVEIVYNSWNGIVIVVPEKNA